MTHKDYEILAAALYMSRKTNLRPALADTIENNAFRMQHIQSCVDVANELAKENPRFDRERFLQACGVGPQP